MRSSVILFLFLISQIFCYSKWSPNNKAYTIGDFVEYQGKVYECTFTHNSNDAWTPTDAITLWKVRTDLQPSIGETEDNEKNKDLKKDDDDKNNSGKESGGIPAKSIEGIPTRVMIGYYHTWDNPGNPFIKLRDVDDCWDVINIAFAVPEQPGSTNGKMKFVIDALSDDYTDKDFKADIKSLHSKGKKIVLSIGGYEGYFTLGSEEAVSQFVKDIKGFIDEYSFDGIDIDLEQSSCNFAQGKDKDIRSINSPILANMVKAIKQIRSGYGDTFILSWAPETFYVQMGYTYYAGINEYCDPRAGSYLPMINALRDETTFLHVQLYNSIAITASDGISYSMGNKASVVAMCKMLLEGFHVGAGVGVEETDATWFSPLRPDQVVIGVPSSTSAAGTGQITNSELQAAYKELNSKYPGMRGIMTWSINWDSSQNNNSFGQDNRAFLDQF